MKLTRNGASSGYGRYTIIWNRTVFHIYLKPEPFPDERLLLALAPHLLLNENLL